MPVVPHKNAAQEYEDEMHARNLYLHRNRVANTRSCVDCGLPESYRLNRRPTKRPLKNSERIYEIEHENLLLVQRMTRIMNGKGSIDNSNPYKGPHCANYLQRMRDLDHLRIEKENRHILHRIENSKTSYPLEKFEQDHYRNAEIAARIGRYQRDPPK